MALKKIGRYDYLGINAGGHGYFVKYCPHCKEKIYLMQGGELEEFLLAVYIPHLWHLLKCYFRARLRIPKIKFNLEFYNPREMEIMELNKRIELSPNTKLILKNPKEFSRTFFEKKYSALGGIKQLDEMVARQYTPTAIGEWFGFSRQRAFDILQSYKFQKIID